MPIPQTVLDLIQRFADNEAAYRAADSGRLETPSAG